MLTLKQVKKLTKSATDKQLCKEGKVYTGETWWTNTFVAFWEKLPEGTAQDWLVKQPNPQAYERLTGMARACGIKVWPVAIQGLADSLEGMYKSKGDAITSQVLLSDGTESVWIDGRYLAAFLKRGATDFYLAPRSKCVACHNGHALGLVMGMEECPHEWRLANWELPKDQEGK